VSYQRDPRIGYIKILHRMSKLDMLIQCTTHIGSGVFACPGGVAEDEFNLSAMPSRNGRYLRAPRKGGAFHWVRAPPGARSIRKQNRMRLIAGQEPVHAQERRFDRPVAAHDHGSGFVRNGDPARRTDAQTEHGAASNLLKSFRDQAALHGQLEVEPSTSSNLTRQRLAGRRFDVTFVVVGRESQSLPSYLKETFTFVR
jgi:hypothetical protein